MSASEKKEPMRTFNPPAAIAFLIMCAFVLPVDIFVFGGPTIPLLSRPVACLLGGSLFVLGVGMVIVAAITVDKGVKAKRLIRTGIFGLIRHPIYSAYAFYITPGAALVLNRLVWLVLLPIVGYFVMGWAIVAPEEERLVKEFGDEYLRYREEVNAYFPTVSRLFVRKDDKKDA